MKKGGEKRRRHIEHYDIVHIFYYIYSFIADISTANTFFLSHYTYIWKARGFQILLLWRNQAAFTQWKCTNPTNPLLPSVQIWQKDTEVTPKRRYSHALISETWPSAQSLIHTACALIADTVTGNLDRVFFLVTMCSQLPGLRLKLSLALLWSLPLLETW